MNKKRIIQLASAVFILLISFVACHSDASQNGIGGTISADEFEAKINENAQAQIADVRTPGEYSDGHIKGAVNIDWNNAAFETEIEKFDKEKPVFVYCLSGGRSAGAVSKMKSIGFKQIYELEGGMRSWYNKNKPVDAGATSTEAKGMTLVEFNEKLKIDKLVLVDFNAKWCAPCKKMAPVFDEIENEYRDKLLFVKIDVEENKTIADELKIENIPTILLYKNGKVIWNHVGLIEKNTLVEVITKN